MITRSWKRILIGTAVGMSAVAAGIWLLIWSLADREVLYQGKALERWLEELNGQTAAVSNRAAFTLSTQIIPQLTNQMFQDTNDSNLRMALVEKLNNLPGVNLQYAPAPLRRAAAARQLGQIGPPAKVAIPALLQVVKGDDATVRAKAAEALGQIHSDSRIVVPALISLLNDPNSNVRTSAAEALAGWGQESRPAVPRLIQLLDDRSDRDLMVAVREALKKIDPEAAAKAGVK